MFPEGCLCTVNRFTRHSMYLSELNSKMSNSHLWNFDCLSDRTEQAHSTFPSILLTCNIWTFFMHISLHRKKKNLQKKVFYILWKVNKTPYSAEALHNPHLFERSLNCLSQSICNLTPLMIEKCIVWITESTKTSLHTMMQHLVGQIKDLFLIIKKKVWQ